jgi:molecular chaperone HscB
MSYFDILSSPVTFDTDDTLLKKNFLKIQVILNTLTKKQRTHPDAFTTKSLQERIISGELSSFANKAYSTLRSPLSRALYLLELKNIDEIAESESIYDSDILSTVMEAREDIAHCRTAEELQEIKQANDGMFVG